MPWPNFFIVGAGKAGTTSLYEYLKTNPYVYMSPLKEPRFFSTVHVNNPDWFRISTKKDYLDLFEKVKNEIAIGEASPQYLRDPMTPKLIYEKIPNAKIIISLRDPVETIFSAYKMLRGEGNLKLSFHQEIQDCIKIGTRFDEYHIDLESVMYSIHVKRYLETFGEKQVKVLIFEEWKKDTNSTLNQILNFLDVKNSSSHVNNKIYMESGNIKSPRGSLAKTMLGSKRIAKMSRKFVPTLIRKKIREDILSHKHTITPMNQEDKELLINYFHADVKKLELMLKRKLPWKNFDE